MNYFINYYQIVNWRKGKNELMVKYYKKYSHGNIN